jgi:hypothetical protein
MTAIQRFRIALQESQIDISEKARILEGYEKLTDRAGKERRAAFFVDAIARMDDLLDFEIRRDIRDACACSKGGWRLKAVRNLARDYAGRSLEDRLVAPRGITHMGKPVLNADGTITAGIGDEGGFACRCPVFQGQNLQEPVSLTYCYCCAGHFRYHYRIALDRKLVTRAVLSSALASLGAEPCSFVFEIVE